MSERLAVNHSYEPQNLFFDRMNWIDRIHITLAIRADPPASE
jgi:hypothetical protein